MGDTLYISLLSAGRVMRLARSGATSVVASALRAPEGLAPAPGGELYVVEQGLNRIDRVATDGSGRVTPLKVFANGSGKLGIDSIHLEQNGNLLVPDSPNGRLLEFNPVTGATSVVATGLGRPVDAIRWTGGIAVADEVLGLLVIPAGAPRPAPPGAVQHTSGIALADDLELDAQGRLLVTGLKDGKVFRVDAGRTTTLASGFSSPQGMALDAAGALLVADEGLGSVLLLPATCLAP